MRGMALIDASPMILMDTSTYDVTSADTHANVKENRCLLVSFTCCLILLGIDFLSLD